MRKALLPMAAILGWSVALTAVSRLEAMDAGRAEQQSVAQKIEVVEADLGEKPEAEPDGTPAE